MTWVALLPLIKKFGPYALIVIAVFSVYMVGRSHGKAKWYSSYQSELEARRGAIERERQALGQLDAVRRGLALCTERTADFKAESAARIARLEEALDKKPEVVYKYREQIATIDDAIQSDDCATALAEAADFLANVEEP